MTIEKKIKNFYLTVDRIKLIEDEKEFRISIFFLELKLLMFYITNYDFSREKLLKMLDMLSKVNLDVSRINTLGRIKHILCMMDSIKKHGYVDRYSI